MLGGVALSMLFAAGAQAAPAARRAVVFFSTCRERET